MISLKRLSLTLLLWVSFFSLPSLFGQCPAPTITIDPMPICSLPVTLSAQAAAYTAYKWSTGAVTSGITVGVNGTYTVTVTCADLSTSSASTTIAFEQPTVQMGTTLMRPCILGYGVRLPILVTNAIPGNLILTLISSAQDTINLENPVTAGTNSITLSITPSVLPITYTILSATTVGGCNYLIGSPKTTNVIPIFESEEQLPTISGDTFFCHNGSTVLNVNWTDPEPTLFTWVTPGFPAGFFPFYTVNQEGFYLVHVTYGNDCELTLRQFVDDIYPVPEITGSPVCTGNPTTLSTTETYESYLWSTGETSPEIEVNESGEYRVTITDSYGCSNFDAAFIPEIPAPNLSINGPIVLCSGQTSAQLVATAANVSTYAWSTGASTADISISGPGSYTVTVTSINGCTTQTTQVVEQINTPTATLASPVIFCQGSSAVLTPVTSTPDVTYLWSTGATTATITVSTGGVYRVSVSDPTLSCTSSALTLVTVLPAPGPTISASSPTICEGGTIVLNTNIGSGNTFLWSNGSTSASITTGTTGTYTVTVTGSNGCTGTDTESIAVLPVPHPQIVGPKSLCGKDSVFISTTTFPKINWSTGDTSTGVWVKAAGNYNVVVTNSAGCTGTAVINIANTVPGTLTVTGGTTLCGSDSLTLVANGPFSAFAWSNGINNDSVIINTPGTYQVIATDNLGCTATRSSIVTNQGGFNTAVSFVPLCNSTVSLNAENGFTGYNWSSGVTTQTYQASAAGTYTVTVTNAAGCTTSSTYTVTVLPEAPVPVVTGPLNICPENSGNLAVSGNYPVYSWSTGSTTATASVAAPGIFTVTVTDQYGCTGSGVVTVGALASPLPSIAGSQTVCNGQPTTLSVSNTYTSFAWSTGESTDAISINIAGNYTVTVTNTNGCASATTIAITSSDILSPNVAIQPYNCDDLLTIDAGAGYSTYLWSNGATTSSIAVSTAGEYALTVTNNNGCIGTTTQLVESIPTTPPVAIQGASVFCANATTILSATANFNTYEWSTGTNNLSIEISTAGTYTVTATDANGCTRTAESTVATNPVPEPVITIDTYKCDGQLTLDAGGPYSSYNWEGGISTSTLIVDQNGTYSVTVVDGNSCSGTATIIANIPVAPVPQIVETPLPNYFVQLEANAGFQSYVWSNGDQTAATVIEASGTYTVTVTDVLGCTGTGIAVVLLDIEPLAVASTQEDITCANGNDGSVVLCINGGQGPYTATSIPAVSFQTSVSPTCDEIITFNGIPAGVFNWTLTDVNNVSSSGSFTFTNPSPIIGNSTVAGTTITASATGGVPPYQYSLDGSIFQNSPVFDSLPNGAYQVVILDARGCTFLTQTVTVFTVSTNNPAGDLKMQITPNPGDGNFWLTMENYPADEVYLNILDVTGKSIRQYTLQTGGTGRYPIDLNDMSEGTYMIQVRTNNAIRTIPVVLIR